MKIRSLKRSKLGVFGSILAGLIFACIGANAYAFPSWMGVYGSYVRHTDGSNPGTYTILMNQDYWGLHAEVGVQVNGGSWVAYQMSYAGNDSGNSKWTFTPGSAYPAGSTVKYYFHGYDNWGGNIWDTNGGSNYSFAIAAIQWPGGAAAGYPSDPANKIHHWKEEAIVGNQYMTVQLDMNGSLYDIYYPSAGFRNGSGTANEGYKGPEEFIGGPYGCSTDLQANGQMNVINGMGGIALVAGSTNSIYWLKNQNGTDYVNVSQAYVTDNNTVITSNRLNIAGNNIQVVQFDFCPTPNALPVVTDGVRTNYGAYVKRFLLTNLESTARTINFYYDVNFNVKGDNAYDGMYYETIGGRNTMVVYDNTNRTVTGGGCGPNGYGGSASTEYNPKTTSSHDKYQSVFFGAALKEVTNTVTGAGIAADGSWRDHTSTDSQEGWIGKQVTLQPGVTKEIDVIIVGSWDDGAGYGDTHSYWGRPLIDWFYANSMNSAQSTTETYWSNWLNAGVTSDLPGTTYDTLFKRSLLATALHIDKASGSIIAGMHNGAYPFVWPRDGVYAAITLDRTGHTQEAEAFYKWLRDIAYRATDGCNPGGKSFFYQKYTTDGYYAWNSPQMDESASVPWGIYYHYLTTKDATFLTNYWSLARESAYASYYTSCVDGRAYYDFTYNLMNGNNVWEDSFGLFIYSNASIVRGLRDAANLADVMNSPSEASGWRAKANVMKAGIDARIDARVEPADISHLGLAVPYEVYQPNESRMLAIKEWIHGGGAPAGGFNDNLEETGGGNAGYWRRYNHNVGGSIDNYWNGGPWFLSTAWYGEYNARWQDYSGGKTLVDVNLNMLDKLVARLGPCGLGAEQIAPDYAQKYPGFWLQAAWPNVWESHSTLIDQMMMFLDYKPVGTNANAVAFAPKLPTGWTTMTFNNLNSQGQRFNVTITENTNNSRADLNKLTSGSLNYDTYLRIPAGVTPSSVVTNGVSYVPAASDYNTTTGRVHVQGALNSGTGNNSIVVNY